MSASVAVRDETFVSDRWRVTWRRRSATAVACALSSRAAAPLAAPIVAGGPRGMDRRSGCCWVSHGTSGRSGGRVRTGGGLMPTIGSTAEPKTPLPRFSVSAPPLPRTLNHGPLASNERLSPARPGRNFARSW